MNLKLSLALLALLPAGVLATEPLETAVVGAKSPAPSEVVRFGDLDLSTPEGMKALNERLSNAAWRVCRQMISKPVSIAGGQCRNQLVDAAKADINQMRLASGGLPILR